MIMNLDEDLRIKNPKSQNLDSQMKESHWQGGLLDFWFGTWGFWYGSGLWSRHPGGVRQALSTVHPHPLPTTAILIALCHTVLPQLLVGPTEGSVSLSLAPRRRDPPSRSCGLTRLLFYLGSTPGRKAYKDFWIGMLIATWFCSKTRQTTLVKQVINTRPAILKNNALDWHVFSGKGALGYY